MADSQVHSIRLLQPSNAAQRAEMLHWDGRLDNLDDLIRKLRESLRGDMSTAALALAAYERWGIGGLIHLIGDWSLVIHDRPNAAVVLASDFAGVRPLYYHVRVGQVLWSRNLQSLVEETQISDLDEDYIAGFLTVGGCPNRTPYCGIYSVPAGHTVRISASETEISPFWTLPTGDVIQYTSEHRYEEQFRALFREAVAVRLQTGSPVLAELSGGLDSSSVVSMANHLIRSGQVPAPRIATVSYHWRDSLDEPFIREVEAFCGLNGIRISLDDNPLIGQTDLRNAAPELFGPVRTAISAIAGRLGAEVLLTGNNGDLMTGNLFDDSLQVAGALRRFKFGLACEEALAWSKILGLPIAWILWRAFRAALPPSWAPPVLFAEPDGSYTPRNHETTLRPDFCARTGIAEPGRFFSNRWMQAVPERRKYFQSLSSILELRTLQPTEPLQHLDYTHPFGHRPLVEFLMTVPPDVLCRPAEPRRLMRRALSDLWPAKVLKRRSKATFDAPWQAVLRPIAGNLLRTASLQVVERGFVNHNGLVSRLERFVAGLDCNWPQLRQVMLLELWLRSREESQLSSATSKAA